MISNIFGDLKITKLTISLNRKIDNQPAAYFCVLGSRRYFIVTDNLIFESIWAAWGLRKYFNHVRRNIRD